MPYTNPLLTGLQINRKRQSQLTTGDPVSPGGQGLVQLVGVEGAVENDNCPYKLGEGDHGVEPLKAFKCCVLVLATLFIIAHVQVRESHFENCICNSKLVILCYGDYVHVPGKDEDERNEDTDEDMDNGILK